VRWLGKGPANVRLAAVAMVILLALLAVRAASVHAIDPWMAARFAGVRRGWWGELVAVLAIAAAAATAHVRPRHQGPAQRSD
jgi:hypothetical protein